MTDRLRADREQHRDALRRARIDPYPTWHGRTHAAAEISANFARLKGRAVTVAGRAGVARVHGGIRFLDLYDASGKIQLLLSRARLGETSFARLESSDPGDFLAATGRVLKTTAGEISIEARTWTLLSKALAPLPEKRAGLKDDEERARRREVDLLANAETRATFGIRIRTLHALRSLLGERGFVEVETPILQHLAGGAAARPFRTHHNALDLDLFLRVAPELFLKRLIIGGYEKVFELGRVFRNEGIDRSHNPEFTMCELYQAYATVEDLIPFTERLIAGLVRAVHGRTSLTYQGQRLSFRPPWKRVRFAAAVRRATGLDILTERRPAAYLAALKTLGEKPPEDTSLPNLMDEVFTKSVRKKTRGPLHVLDAPAELVPLAKRRPDVPRLAQRLQVVVAGMELVNAYTEENDPVEQSARFQEQATLRGQTEIHPLDAEYIEALKLGLPPTAGWGLGVDRLVMLLADTPNIRDVLFFPLLRPR